MYFGFCIGGLCEEDGNIGSVVDWGLGFEILEVELVDDTVGVDVFEVVLWKENGLPSYLGKNLDFGCWISTMPSCRRARYNAWIKEVVETSELETEYHLSIHSKNLR